MPTATLEEYLESIYKLSRKGGVRPGQIAEAMGVSAPTVTATLRRLAAGGLVTRPRGAVSLTREGEREALSILRRHRLAERFLVDVLGLPWEDVHEDACLLEHALSPQVQDALERFLESPASCPHGHPIPNSDLVLVEASGVQLTSLSTRESGIVLRVDESDESALGRAASLGLLPGARVRVLVSGNDATAMVVEIRGEPCEVTRDLAARVTVEPTEEPLADG